MMIKANMRTAAFSQASAQRSVVCKAADQHVAARRSVMLGFGSILPAMISMPALALILVRGTSRGFSEQLCGSYQLISHFWAHC